MGEVETDLQRAMPSQDQLADEVGEAVAQQSEDSLAVQQLNDPLTDPLQQSNAIYSPDSGGIVQATEEDGAPVVEQGSDVGLQTGVTGQVEAEFEIPLPWGLTLSVSFNGSAAVESQDADSTMAISGEIRLELAWEFLFLRLYAFVGGAAEIQVAADGSVTLDDLPAALNVHDESSYLRRGIDEIAMWWAARKLDELEERRLALHQAYRNAEVGVTALHLSLTQRRNQVQDLRRRVLDVRFRLEEIREELLDEVNDIYGDLEVEIDQARIVDQGLFYDTAWARLFQQVYSEHPGCPARLVVDPLFEPMVLHLQERQADVAALEADDLGIVNDPQVGFELGFEVGAGAAIALGERTNVGGEFADMDRATDEIGQTEFDTSTEDVTIYRINGSHTFGGNKQFEFEFGYETTAAGREISGQVGLTVGSQEVDLNEESVQSVLQQAHERVLDSIRSGNVTTTVDALKDIFGDALENLVNPASEGVAPPEPDDGGLLEGDVQAGIDMQLGWNDQGVTGGHMRFFTAAGGSMSFGGNGGPGGSVAFRAGSYVGIGT